MELPRTRQWVERGIARASHSSCQIAVVWDGGSAEGSWGTGPAGDDVHAGTRYPLTCLTKPLLAVALAVAAVDRAAPVSHYLPAFGGAGRDDVRIAHLLSHTAMLEADPAPWLTDAATAREQVLGLRVAPGQRPGTATAYSSFANWYLLGAVLEAHVGAPAYDYVTEEVLRPLGLSAIDLRPSDVAAVTPLRFDVGALEGRAHAHVGDGFSGMLPGGAWWPGVVGVGTARDMADFFRSMLSARRGDPGSIVSPADAVALTTPWRAGLGAGRASSDLTWGLGFVVDPRPFGGAFSPGVFSHTGLHTSSVAFADPGSGVAGSVIFDHVLTGPAALLRLAGTISKLVADLAELDVLAPA